MEIVRLQAPGDSELADINGLLEQLTRTSRNYMPVTQERLQYVISHPDNELWVANDNGKIVGMATLILAHKVPATTAFLEHIVVNETHRGQGLGKQLVEKIIERARERGAEKLDLTSHPTREAANKMYQKLGFTLHDTNFYRMKF